MTVAKLAEVLHANLHNGQLELKADTIAHTLIQGLTFQNATITKIDDRLILTGSVSLLNVEDLQLEVLFQDVEGTIRFNLSATHRPTVPVSRANWEEQQDETRVESLNSLEDLLPIILGDSTAPLIPLATQTHLPILNQSILTGEVQLSNDGFQLQGDLDLFSPSFPLQLKGHVSGRLSHQSIYFQSHVRAALTGINLEDAQVRISQKDCSIVGNWLGAKTTLSLQKTSQGEFVLRGKSTIPLRLDRVHFGATHVPTHVNSRILSIKVADDWNLLNLGAVTGLDVTVSEDSFSARMTTTAQINQSVVALAPVNLTIAPSNLHTLSNQIKNQLRDVAANLFLTQFPTADAWLQGIQSSTIGWGTSHREMGIVLGQLYRLNEQQAAQSLKAAHFPVGDVAHVMSHFYHLNIQRAIQVLRNIGYSATEVGITLLMAFNQSAQRAAQVLRSIDYSAIEVGMILNRVYGQETRQAAQVLRNVGYSATEVGITLRKVFGQSAPGAAQTLKNIGYSAIEVGRTLKNVFGQGADSTARILKGTGYSLDKIGRVLKDVFGQGRDAILGIFKQIGDSVLDYCVILKMLVGF